MKTVILLSLLWIQHEGEKGNDFDQSGRPFSVTWRKDQRKLPLAKVISLKDSLKV